MIVAIVLVGGIAAAATPARHRGRLVARTEDASGSSASGAAASSDTNDSSGVTSTSTTTETEPSTPPASTPPVPSTSSSTTTLSGGGSAPATTDATTSTTVTEPTFHGHVYTSSGTPLGNVCVDFAYPTGLEGVAQHVETAADGSWHISFQGGAVPAPIQFRDCTGLLPGYNDVRTTTLVSGDQTITMQPAAGVEGTLVHADGSPWLGACLTVYTGFDIRFSPRVDATGHFAVGGMPSGTFQVQGSTTCLSAPTYTPPAGWIPPADGQYVYVTFVAGQMAHTKLVLQTYASG